MLGTRLARLCLGGIAWVAVGCVCCNWSLGDSLLESQRAFMDGRALLNGWQGTYGSFSSMRAVYCECLVFPPEAENRRQSVDSPKPTRWQYIDRVEEGVKFHTRYSNSAQGLSHAASVLEAAFDGAIGTEYIAATSQGTVERGLKGRNFERMNSLAVAMMADPIGPQRKPRLSLMALVPEDKLKVLPELARVADEPCHVVELGNLPADGYRVWLAHEKGMLPLKFEAYDHGQVTAKVTVEKLASTETVTGPIWYPAKSRRTVFRSNARFEYELTVEQFVPNVATDEKTFRVQFPRGTHVGDFVAGVEYTVGSEVNPSGMPNVHAMIMGGAATRPSSGTPNATENPHDTASKPSALLAPPVSLEETPPERQSLSGAAWSILISLAIGAAASIWYVTKRYGGPGARK